MQGSGCKFQGSGFRVQGSGLRGRTRGRAEYGDEDAIIPNRTHIVRKARENNV